MARVFIFLVLSPFLIGMGLFWRVIETEIFLSDLRDELRKRREKRETRRPS